MAFFAASSPSFGLGGNFGDEVPLLGVALFALSVAPLAVDLGVLVALLGAPLGESAALVDCPSFDVELEAGFLPALVGVLGVPLAALPAAGDGAMLFDVRAVFGVVELDDLLGEGEVRLGVGGKE